MFDFNEIPSSLLWLVVAIILGIIEASTLGLVTVWFAIGAVLAMFSALIGLPFGFQVAIFIISSAVLLYYTRPIAKNYLKIGSVKTNADRFIGQIGMVVQKIDVISGTGQVKVMGQIWSAKSADNQDIEEDRKVEVLEISGVKLVVREVKNQTENQGGDCQWDG